MFSLVAMVAVVALVGFDLFGVGLQLVRQVVVPLFLVVVPGALLLGILDIEIRDRPAAITCTLGLGVGFVMAIGLLSRSLSPLVGISRPLSIMPLLGLVMIIVPALVVVFWYRRPPFETEISVGWLADPQAVFVLSLPLSGVAGGVLLAYYDSNLLLLLFLMLASVAVILVATDRIRGHYVPLVVWALSFSILMQSVLATPYEFTLSITGQYQTVPEIVVEQGSWPGGHPWLSLASIVFFLPVVSLLADVTPRVVDMFVYPPIYSMVPVALYYTYRHQTDRKVAFYATFLVMSFYSFYTVFAHNSRTGLAELFLVLVAYLVVSSESYSLKPRLLTVVFLGLLVVSHYGTSYMLLFALLVGLPFYYATRVVVPSLKQPSLFSLSMTSVYLTIDIAWFINSASGVGFAPLVGVGAKTFRNAVEWLRYGRVGGSTATYIQDSLSPSINAAKYILYAFALAAAVTLLLECIRVVRNRSKFDPEFLVLGGIFGMFLPLTFVVPGFNIARVGHIAFVFLAPISAVGILRFQRRVSNALSIARRPSLPPIFAVILVVFFLLGTGFVAETITRGNDYGPYIPISEERIETLSADDERAIGAKRYLYKRAVTVEDQAGSRWLARYATKPAVDFGRPKLTSPNLTIDRSDRYLFVRSYNVREGIIVTSRTPLRWSPTNIVIQRINRNESNRIYTNGGSVVYD
jgi:uncharacterized membrane protein